MFLYIHAIGIFVFHIHKRDQMQYGAIVDSKYYIWNIDWLKSNLEHISIPSFIFTFTPYQRTNSLMQKFSIKKNGKNIHIY